MSVYSVPPAIAEKAHINKEKYDSLYQQSITDSDGFWAEQAQALLSWQKPWDSVSEFDF